MEDFVTRIDMKMEEFERLMNSFYQEEFENLKFTTKPTAIVIDIVKILKQKNYKLIVATISLFPRTVILHRIQWTGLNDKDFSLITDYESAHFCKPNLEYFQEILSIIEKTPEECLMVGNDVQEDLVVSKLGMKTFLIEDHIINREDSKPQPDFTGSYKDLLKYVEELPSLKEE
ncbi:FMN phosphatase YigB (HAD superfamily) [Marinisporobacter balticus]|uniref:FMN phosphatase YigB (HAD superfamily) n=2 Tax=Marinisporobacter balticus TaxID=2018667 RepID=A0A4V6NPI5_9FIRM|nr:FMN phosphatase YigB (HAD superfamily) [Marinisporobacter balticus]